jgi:hypothetical protein
MATDLGLRIGDFIRIRKTDLPDLDQQTPTSLDLMTDKEKVIAHGFLSQETADLLKAYLPTLERKNGNPYLFPSNGESHISDEWLNRLLQRLAEKAQIRLNGKSLTFHCFRKMFLSASIDSGVGLTAGKKLCGKAIGESDDTYLTTVDLRGKFIQLKKFLTIKETTKLENSEVIESLKDAVAKLHEELTQQKTVTDAVTEKNIRITKDFENLQKQLTEIQQVLSLIREVVTPEMLTQLQLEKIHKEHESAIRQQSGTNQRNHERKTVEKKPRT